MIKWLGENGGELVGTKKYLCAKKRIFVYKLVSFVGFIGDEQVHAQECYDETERPSRTQMRSLAVHTSSKRMRNFPVEAGECKQSLGCQHTKTNQQEQTPLAEDSYIPFIHKSCLTSTIPIHS
jgi:hypothetical protein